MMFFHIYIPNIGSYFKTDLGENCPREHIIDSKDMCKNAADELGLSWFGGLWKPEGYKDFPTGCFWRPDVKGVDFNEMLDPSKTNLEKYKYHTGICKNPSKRLFYNCP